MNRLTRLTIIPNQMTSYGLMLGTVAGFLVTWVILMMNLAQSNIDVLTGVILSFLPGRIGALIGAIYGAVAGLLSGLSMALVAGVSYGEIRDSQRFKQVMGAITAIVSGGVFLLGHLWALALDEGRELMVISIMGMSIVIAVYVSQIVSKKYINEISIRKQKGEA